MRNIFILLMLLALAGCKNFHLGPAVKLTGAAQGTYYAVTYYDEEQRDFQQEIDSLLDAFDMSASVYQPSSVISLVNSNQSDTVDEIFREVFLKGIEVAQITDGAFDMTVMPLVNAWGFGFKDPEMLPEDKVDSIMQYVGYKKVSLNGDRIIKTNENVMIDFNAIAQGYSVDLVGSFLEEQGIENYLVDIGGEVLANGKKPGLGLWKVGIEKPTENSTSPRTIKAVVSLKNRALATSGNYRKYYEKNGVRYSHTINPKTGYPVKHFMLSASVMARDAATADAFATAFMVMGLDKAKEMVAQRDDLEAYFIFTNPEGVMRTHATPGMRRFMDVEE
jgi:thiamine biosynthesis lipoprotein